MFVYQRVHPTFWNSIDLYFLLYLFDYRFRCDVVRWGWVNTSRYIFSGLFTSKNTSYFGVHGTVPGFWPIPRWLFLVSHVARTWQAALCISAAAAPRARQRCMSEAICRWWTGGAAERVMGKFHGTSRLNPAGDCDCKCQIYGDRSWIQWINNDVYIYIYRYVYIYIYTYVHVWLIMVDWYQWVGMWWELKNDVMEFGINVMISFRWLICCWIGGSSRLIWV